MMLDALTADTTDELTTENMMLRRAYTRAITFIRAHGYFLSGFDAATYRQICAEAHDLKRWGVLDESEVQL